MNTNRFLLLAALCISLLFGACHSVPPHARYIPKDALAVISVNTFGISKEVAWSKITGSKILDDMEKAAKSPNAQKAAAGMKDIEHSGIDFTSVLYFYLKPDTRFRGSQRGTAVLPLKNKTEWETWLKKVWPEANIHTVGDRREALLDGKWYAGWNSDVLMIMNTAMTRAEESAPQPMPDTAIINADVLPSPYPNITISEKADEPATAAEMELAFKLPKDASIIEDAHFKTLAGEGHDVSYFVNYDVAMSSASALSAGTMGMSMGATLWKGTALTGGFNFDKGAVNGDMRYYTSDSLKAIAQEFGRENFDGDMAARLPGGGLNLAAGYHLSPKALKMILDKMGYTGLANLYLSPQGFSVDNILSAFTGDIVFSMNNFSMATELRGNDSVSQSLGMTPYPSSMPKLDYLFVMKIGDKAAFDRLFAFVNTQAEGALVQSAPGTYTLAKAAGSGYQLIDNLTFTISDKYFAVGNNPASIQAFFKGAGTVSADVKQELSGHPIGFYADVQSMLQAGSMVMGSPTDSSALTLMKNLFANGSMAGGEYKAGANEYKMSLKMIDKSESSLLQLLQFAQRMAALKQQPASPAI